MNCMHAQTGEFNTSKAWHTKTNYASITLPQPQDKYTQK